MGTVDFPSCRVHIDQGLSAPIGLVANDLSRVTFLVLFMVEGECDVKSVGGGGGGGELGGGHFPVNKKH